MTCAIVYSSRTGNTRRLAETVQASLPQACLYMGPPDDAALAADRLYIGFWTDKGTCDAGVADFLSKVSGKEVFLFGTAGFGGEPAYFESILGRVAQCLGPGNTVIGTFMCQGRMPMAVRERYEKMLYAPPSPRMPDPRKMLENFDRALPHPDEEDLARLKAALAASCRPHKTILYPIRGFHTKERNAWRLSQ